VTDVALHKSHRKHNKLALIPLQNWIILVFFFFLFNFQGFYVLATLQWHQSSREKQLMIVMMKEERCASDGLLLEGKK
jgi:hypothetical protein